MKGSRIYMILLFLFLVVVFLFEYMSPHKFVWIPTYDKNDKEPFGSFVFDDILSSSIDDYSVINKTFYQILQEDSTISNSAFLITEAELSFIEVDIESLYKLIHLGNQIMICSVKFPDNLKDTLCFETTYESYFQSLNVYVQKQNKRDNIYLGTDTLNPEYTFNVYPHFHPVSLNTWKNKWIRINTGNKPATNGGETPEYVPITDDVSDIDDENVFYEGNATNGDSIINEDDGIDYEDFIGNKEYIKDENNINSNNTKKLVSVPINCDSMKILAWDSDNNPLIIRAFIGKGELFIVSTPLMFTNYGLLDGSNASYAFRLLSYMKGKPLIRVEAYGNHDEKPKTPLRYILSEPPLRWATYFTIALLISFMIFAAKRRQRIIPVVNAPPNRSLEFMQLISNLYYQKHNNGEILKMKHTYFCAEVKAHTGIDLQETLPNDQDFQRLTEKTGIEIKQISDLLKNIQMTLYRSEVDDINLKKYIDGMNEIRRQLTIDN